MDDSGKHNTQGGGKVRGQSLPPSRSVEQAAFFNEPNRLKCKDIMEALEDSNINMIGVCGYERTTEMGSLLENVSSTAKRKKLFDVIKTTSLKGETNLGRIQQKIADVLGCSIQEEKETSCLPSSSNKKIVTERARQLSGWIKEKEKVLLMVSALDTQLDLAKIGIPFGEDHKGCKVIVVSESEKKLSQMKTQKIFLL
ncbi:hypothetical protein L6164_017378 [Bauhinia variegata]|uniref:Uncharacterized protein n=1 Tax=Bauhinia variegata TaxID=167791 RepID=A0ACB9N7K5_BAUVA|nr:hypothetical protein L6164_017378 [Bauhinia variegata]